MLVTETNVQTIRKSFKSKVDTLPDDLVVAVWTLLAPSTEPQSGEGSPLDNPADIRPRRERKRTAEWLEHPWKIPGFKPIPRDALYDRT
jgi:hypothetical protein